MRRSHNHKSQHYVGKAVDFEFSHSLIDYLVSESGKAWLAAHNLMFYIEGRPGSSKVAKYLKNPVTREFVFFNPNATGDHVHVGAMSKHSPRQEDDTQLTI